MDEVRNGRSHVAVAAALFFLASLTVGGLTMAVGVTKPVVLAVRLLVALSLAVAMFKGANWARWTVVVLAGIGGLSAVSTAIMSGPELPLFGKTIIGALGIFYLALAGFLAFSRSVASYFRASYVNLEPYP